MNRCFLPMVFIACSGVLAFGQMAVKHGEVSVRAVTQIITGSVLHLKGAVQITTDKIAVSADEADFNGTSGEIEARGNVRVNLINLLSERAPKTVTIERFQVNLNTARMVFSGIPSGTSLVD